MATPHPQLRQLKDRQGVQKTSASPKNAACQACHARKKRCVPASAPAPAHHYRCINCCREGRNCLPRAVPPRLPQRQSNNTATNKASPSGNKFNIPLPHGIDHEVPRWSAMYSMFSEMLRLIPPDRVEDEDDVKHEACMGRENGMDADLSDNRSGSAREDDMKDATAMPEDDTSESSTPRLSTNPAVGKAVDLPDIGSIRAEFSLGDLDALLRF